MTQKRTIFFVSDGTGITAETLAHGLLSQFDSIKFREKRYPFLDSVEKATACLARIQEVAAEDGARPLVMMTLMNPEFGAILRQADALFLDLFEAFIVPMEQELGVSSSHSVGRSHGQANREYANRIAAVNFALAHDDGVSDTDLKNADVILIGVSRSGKTPTSLYLSLQFSLKAANYPLIPEDFERGYLPERLMPYRAKLFGLTITPEQLSLIRQERKPNSRYASLENCRKEVESAERMMRRANIPWLDTTSRSIEEIAVKLIQTIR